MTSRPTNSPHARVTHPPAALTRRGYHYPHARGEFVGCPKLRIVRPRGGWMIVWSARTISCAVSAPCHSSFTQIFSRGQIAAYLWSLKFSRDAGDRPGHHCLR
jgi:hypothetical protein